MSNSEDMSDNPEHDYVLTPDINGAEAAKAKGNELYKAKKFDDALEQYTKAHELYPTNAIYLGNRSAVYIAKNDYSNALRDSQEATKLDSSYIKGYSRQIKCNIAMGNLGAAKQTCQYVKSSVVFDGEFDDVFKVDFWNFILFISIGKFIEQKTVFLQKKKYFCVLKIIRISLIIIIYILIIFKIIFLILIIFMTILILVDLMTILYIQSSLFLSVSTHVFFFGATYRLTVQQRTSLD